MKNFARKYLQNVRLFVILFLAILIGGLVAYSQIPRELSPSIELPIVAVYALYPGANASDVEVLVTNKIETALKSVDGIDIVTSSAADNFSMSIIQFSESTDLDQAYNQVHQKMIQIVDFPEGVDTPTLYKVDFDDTPIWYFNLEGPDSSGLAALSDQLKESIEAKSLIDRVDTTGGSNREIQLILNQEKVNQLGLSPVAISQTIAQYLNNLPAGTTRLNEVDLAVSIDQKIVDIDTLRQTPLRLNGNLYSLGDLVAIVENEKPSTTQSFQLQDGQIKQTVSLAVYKMAGQPIDKANDQAKTAVDEFLSQYPDYSITTIMDTGQEISDTFSDLMLNLMATFVLVFIVMLLFLGFKEALVSAVTIPMVMLLAVLCMSFFDISINMISLMALLLALGLLVDNAIVVVTALNRTYRRGHGKISALKAAVNVWQEFFSALISTNLTTVWAFLPLLLMTGIMGDFIHPIPIVVSIAIIGSALVAFFISLPLGVLILDKKIAPRIQKLLFGLVCIIIVALCLFILPIGPISILASLGFLVVIWLLLRLFKHRRQQPKTQTTWWVKGKAGLSRGFINIEKLEVVYSKLLYKILNNKKVSKRILTMIIIVAVVAFILPFTPLITTEFMPSEETPTLYVDVELPVGTAAVITQEKMLTFLEDFKEFPYAHSISASLGSGATGMGGMGGGSNHQFRLTLDIIEDKNVPKASQILQDLRVTYKDHQDGKVTISQSQGDMAQMGSAVQVSIMGPDKDILGEYAKQIADYLATIPGVINAITSNEENPSQLIFEPDLQRLSDYNLGVMDVYSAMRTTLSGNEVGKLTLSDTEYDLTFRYSDEQTDFNELEKLQITSGEDTIPLSSLGYFRLKPNLGTISHQSYQPVNTISADVLTGYSGTEIQSALMVYIAEMNMPADYTLASGGMNEIFADSMQSLVLAMIIAFALILFTLVMQLGSFRMAAIVMSAIPIAICGVFLLFALLGITLSVTSVIGILALFGIVVNNSILIIERINQNLVSGLHFKQSIVDGATSRLQPIIMTSLTTIIGLLPITLSNIMWRGLGGAIIAGLTFSGTLLLIFIPILYQRTFDKHHLETKAIKWTKFKQKLLG